MAHRDLFNNIKAEVAVSAQNYANGTDNNGKNIDLQFFESATIEIIAGVLATAGDTDSTYTFRLQEADEDPATPGTPDTYAAVPQDRIQGTNFSAATDGKFLVVDGTVAAQRDKVYKFGYIGNKRFIRVQFDVASKTDGMPTGAIAVLNSARHAPVS